MGIPPLRHAMKRPTAHLLRAFATGLVAALPLAATVAVLWWAVSLLLRWLGPDSAIGGVLAAIGLGVTGSEIVGYLIGIGIVLLAILVLGLVVEAGLQRGVAGVLQALLRRIPLVGQVYDLAHRMVGLFAQRDQEGLKSMSPVWCSFGGPDGPDGAARVKVLALLATREPVPIGGQRYYGVIVPTAPVPIGGGLLYLPCEWVTPADVGLDALTSIYVSMGVTTGQYLGKAARPPRPG
jgi:uncharacterized membrane protein